MAIGKIGSFATTEAPQDYISGALQNVENQGFRYRAERRLAEDEKKKEEEEKQQGIVTDLGKINLSETTPYESHNALAIDGANKLFTFTSQLARDYSDGKISKVEYEIGKKNAMNQITLINEANKRINEQFKNYSTILAKGELAPGTEQDVLRLGGAYDNVRMKWEINPQGTLEAIAYDEEGNVIERGGLDKFGNNTFKPIYNYDFDQDKKDFITTYPKPENDKIVGITIESTKGLTPEIREAINLKVKSVMSNPNALAIKAKEITGKINPNVTDEKVIKQVEENLIKEYESLYAPEKGIKAAPKYDAPSGGSGSGSGKEEKPSPNIMWSSKTVVGKEYKMRNKDGTTREMTAEEKKKHKGSNFVEMGGIKVPVGTMIIPTTDAERDMGNGKKVFVNGIGVSPDGNNFYIKLKESGFETETTTQGSSTDKQSSSSKVTRTMVIDVNKNATDAAVYAKLLGYSNLNDFKQDILNQTGVRVSKQPTPKSGAKPATKKETAQERIARLKRQKGLK